jgi:hypothetical protein
MPRYLRLYVYMALCYLKLVHAHMGFIKKFNTIYLAQNTFRKIVPVPK